MTNFQHEKVKYCPLGMGFLPLLPQTALRVSLRYSSYTHECINRGLLVTYRSASAWHKPGVTGRERQLKNCSDHTGQRSCLRGIFLIANGCREAQPPVNSAIPREVGGTEKGSWGRGSRTIDAPPPRVHRPPDLDNPSLRLCSQMTLDCVMLTILMRTLSSLNKSLYSVSL